MKTLNQVVADRKNSTPKKKKYKKLPKEVEEAFNRYIEAYAKMGTLANDLQFPSYAELDKSCAAAEKIGKEFENEMREILARMKELKQKV